MDHWSKDMFAGHGVLFDRAQHVGDPNPKVMRGLFEYDREGCGIDQRMRVNRWLEDLESKGGKLVIESVTPERLDEIALYGDVTVLAAGKAELAQIVPRDSSEANSTSRNAISPWPLYEVNPGGTCGNGSRTAGNMCRPSSTSLPTPANTSGCRICTKQPVTLLHFYSKRNQADYSTVLTVCDPVGK